MRDGVPDGRLGLRGGRLGAVRRGPGRRGRPVPPEISLSQYGVGPDGWLFSLWVVVIAAVPVLCYRYRPVPGPARWFLAVGVVGNLVMAIVRTDEGGLQLSTQSKIHTGGAVLAMVGLPLGMVLALWYANAVGAPRRAPAVRLHDRHRHPDPRLGHRGGHRRDRPGPLLGAVARHLDRVGPSAGQPVRARRRVHSGRPAARDGHAKIWRVDPGIAAPLTVMDRGPDTSPAPHGISSSPSGSVTPHPAAARQWLGCRSSRHRAAVASTPRGFLVMTNTAPAVRRPASARRRPHVVVLGGGFGGLTTVRALAKVRRRHHPGRPAHLQRVPAAAVPGGDGRPEPR